MNTNIIYLHKYWISLWPNCYEGFYYSEILFAKYIELLFTKLLYPNIGIQPLALLQLYVEHNEFDIYIDIDIDNEEFT